MKVMLRYFSGLVVCCSMSSAEEGEPTAESGSLVGGGIIFQVQYYSYVLPSLNLRQELARRIELFEVLLRELRQKHHHLYLTTHLNDLPSQCCHNIFETGRKQN